MEIFIPYITYEVGFERFNGTRGKDYFHAKDEFMAIRLFKECYRGGKYTVLWVLPTNLKNYEILR